MTDPTDPDEILKGPAALSAEGRLEQRMAKMEPAGAPSAPERPDEPLELADRPPPAIQQRVERYRADLRARSSRPWALKLVIAILVLGVGGLAALLHFKPKLEWPTVEGVRHATLLDQLGAGGEHQPIIISSTPTGATIVIGGKTVGETPWAGENTWTGETTLVLQLSGYRPWEGKLKGGQPQTLDIRLKR